MNELVISCDKIEGLRHYLRRTMEGTWQAGLPANAFLGKIFQIPLEIKGDQSEKVMYRGCGRQACPASGGMGFSIAMDCIRQPTTRISSDDQLETRNEAYASLFLQEEPLIHF